MGYSCATAPSNLNMANHPTRVPTLDLRRLDSDRERFVAEVRRAYQELGFCSFSHHGIDPALIRRAYAAFENFFKLPIEAKLRCLLPGRAGTRGYTPLRVETAKTSTVADLKEFYHIGREDLTPDHPYREFMEPNVWPAELPDFRPAALALYTAMEQLGLRVGQAMALAIDLPIDYFQEATRDGNSVLRALHYPPVRREDLPAVRAEAHEDISLITLLLGAQGAGLELLTADGQWIPVNAPEGAVVVNVGDMLQRLTNHVYRSTTHRVVNPEGEAAGRSRYSIPFFMDPRPDFLIETLPQCVSEQNPNRYPDPIRSDDYLHQRLAEIKLS